MFTNEKPFFEIDPKHVRVHPFNVKAPENVEFDDNFPKCCTFHTSIIEPLEDFVNNFPNSHEERSIAKNLYLNKEDIRYILEKIPRQVRFIEQFILNKKDDEDWYEEITDYIEYNIDSLGSPSFGLGTFLGALKHWILNADVGIENHKRQELVLYLEQYINPEVDLERTNFNRLNSIHQRWLSSFPFELSFFRDLEPHFRKRLPFLSEKPRVNRFTNLAKAKIHTESSFVIALLDLTKSILSKIDSVQLFEDGKISSTEQRRLELIKQERKVKSKELLEQYSQRELKYIKTIKQWLKDEKEFFLELKSIDLKEVKAKPSKRNIKNTDSRLVSFGYKTKDTTNLKKFVLELNRQVYFLKDGEKSVENFIKVLNSKDLSKEMPEVYFNCETTQLYYIFNKLKPYFNKLTFKNIEKSQLFYTKNGTLLKAQNLSASKVDLPKNYKEIDQAFTLLQ